jgi:uncharacterized protein YbaP (TraB family)
VLWRFEKDGRHGYLYGTIHVGKLEWVMPGRVVDQALREADIIAMELDPADPSVAEGINAPQKAQEAPVVSTALWNRLRAQAASVCVPWETLHALPPLMILARLEMLEARWVGLDEGYAVEFVLGGFARATRKDVAVLETVAVQRAAIMGGSPEEQIGRIERGLSALETGKIRRSTAVLAEAWASGDLERLERYREWCECDTPDESADLDRLAFARNADLTARIEDLHRNAKRVFAAIGILHMVGDKGIPRLLMGRGFKVERVTFP